MVRMFLDCVLLEKAYWLLNQFPLAIIDVLADCLVFHRASYLHILSLYRIFVGRKIPLQLYVQRKIKRVNNFKFCLAFFPGFLQN